MAKVKLLTFVVLWSLLQGSCGMYYSNAPIIMKKTTFYWDRLAKNQGPNVCPRESVPGKDVTYDRAWTGGSYCGRFTSVKYQCCEGYAMVPGEPGCPFAKSVLAPAEAGRSVDAGLFLSLQESAGLNHYFKTRLCAVTILAPLDKALRKTPEHLMTKLNYSAQAATRFVDGPSVLTFSTVEGRVSLKHLDNNKMLISLYNQQKIRMNVYPNGLVTANCIPVVQGDVETTHGVIHTIEEPLDTRFLYPVADTIFGDPKLRKFSNYIVQGHFESTLRQDDLLTVFAPTDEAFDRLSSDYVHSLHYDDVAIKALVDHHIVRGVHCSSILYNATLKSRDGSFLRSRCTQSGIFVSGAALKARDKMATNGVIHIVDRVILPKRAKFLLHILTDLGLTTMASLVKNSGLASTFTSSSSFTLFAPTNSAFEGLDKYSLTSLLHRPSEAHTFVLNHMASGRNFVRNLQDKQTLVSKGTRNPMRIKFFRSKVMVDDVVISRSDIEGLNGVIHIVEDVLLPPKETITELLTRMGNFTRFLSALRTTIPSLLQRLDSKESPFTVFAVPDGYIDYWFGYRWNFDSRYFNFLLENHIVPDTIFMGSIPAGGSSSVNTLVPEQLLLKRSASGHKLFAGGSHVLDSDIVCLNGVVHVVNRVIQIHDTHIIKGINMI